jgi:three-Cys-motif partner protein
MLDLVAQLEVYGNGKTNLQPSRIAANAGYFCAAGHAGSANPSTDALLCAALLWRESTVGLPVVNDEHFFGGEHTETKLDCLRKYLIAFSIALRDQGFARLYIDAFAGTGSRAEVHAALPVLGTDETTVVTTEGSAKIALATLPAFHHICLIEQDAGKIPALQKAIKASPNKSAHIRQGDANEIVRSICTRTAWRGAASVGKGIRGVIFLDPYGMEVEWRTVEAIGETQALDCWYFFPLAGLYRNAPHDPDRLDPSKVKALNRVLGTEEWRQKWYSTPEIEYDLLGPVNRPERRDADVDAIETYVRGRLASVFKGGVLPPLRILNSSGAPLASLFFAISNPAPKAIGLATKIAAHILKRGNSS